PSDLLTFTTRRASDLRISLIGTNFRRCSRIAKPNVLATMPTSEAIASPTTDNPWNSAEYTGKEARVMRVVGLAIASDVGIVANTDRKSTRLNSSHQIS